ncbi:MAG: YqiA/YcfP family alpha/beta fold hydrolase [Aeromonas sp.]
MRSVLLYLHGFNSSPRSLKAQQMAAWLAAERPDIQLLIPQLPATPAAAWQQLHAQCTALRADPKVRLGLVGSSLGGFFAARLSAAFDCRAALINPAVRPHALLKDYLGWQQNPYTGERYELLPAHINELAALYALPLVGERCWLLAQTGDEVLDYREAQAAYPFARRTFELGGDHAFVDFGRYLAPIVAFLGL